MKRMLTLVLGFFVVSLTLSIFSVHMCVSSSKPPATEWSRTYGGASDDRAQSMVQTSDGGYIITGITESCGAGHWDFWLVKTSSTGDVEWNQTYGGVERDIAESVVKANDGGYAMGGSTRSWGAGVGDFWLVKTDVAGNMQWNRTYGGTNHEESFSMIKTSDGGYLLAGMTRSWGAGNDDFWLVKTSSTGDVEWNQTYGGTSLDNAKSSFRQATEDTQ